MIVPILHVGSIDRKCQFSIWLFSRSSFPLSLHRRNILNLTLALPLPRCVILTTPRILSPHGILGLARELRLLESLDECHNNASSPDYACEALQGLPSESYYVKQQPQARLIGWRNCIGNTHMIQVHLF
jgi:hypothetical protein